MKEPTRFLAQTAALMGTFALFRYLINGSLENWQWPISLFVAIAFSGYNTWKSIKKSKEISKPHQKIEE